jgi:hypothetical protein
MKKTVFLTGILAVSSLFGFSKSYEITLANASKVGSVQLKAGQYRVKLNGAQAVFTEVESSKQITVPVKVENAAKKFDETRVDASKEGNVDTLKDIQLGGSTTQIDF